MRIKRVNFVLVNSYLHRNRILQIQIEDINHKVYHIEEELWESDAIDVVSTIFNNALRCFHEDHIKGGMVRL